MDRDVPSTRPTRVVSRTIRSRDARARVRRRLPERRWRRRRKQTPTIRPSSRTSAAVLLTLSFVRDRFSREVLRRESLPASSEGGGVHEISRPRRRSRVGLHRRGFRERRDERRVHVRGVRIRAREFRGGASRGGGDARARPRLSPHNRSRRRRRRVARRPRSTRTRPEAPRRDRRRRAPFRRLSRNRRRSSRRFRTPDPRPRRVSKTRRRVSPSSRSHPATPPSPLRRRRRRVSFRAGRSVLRQRRGGGGQRVANLTRPETRRPRGLEHRVTAFARPPRGCLLIGPRCPHVRALARQLGDGVANGALRGRSILRLRTFAARDEGDERPRLLLSDAVGDARGGGFATRATCATRCIAAPATARPTARATAADSHRVASSSASAHVSANEGHPRRQIRARVFSVEFLTVVAHLEDRGVGHYTRE